MSIYSSHYERYDGPIEPARTRFTVIAETELRRLYREKWVRRLFLMAWVPVIWFAGQLYFELILKKFVGEGPNPDAVYTRLFDSETFFVATMLAAFGSSMVARDVNNSSLTLYFTRPLDVDQYMWGKLLAVILCVFGVTLVPGLLLAVAQLAMTEGPALAHFLNMSWRIVVTSVADAAMVSTLILLMSSIGRSTRYIGMAWLGAFVFLEIARQVLTGVMGPYALLDLMSLGRLFIGTAECLIEGDTAQVPALVAVCSLSIFFYIALRARLVVLQRRQT